MRKHNNGRRAKIILQVYKFLSQIILKWNNNIYKNWNNKLKNKKNKGNKISILKWEIIKKKKKN